jgi:PAS domain S-box-containing protein
VAPDGMAVIDGAGVVLEVNAAWERMFGYDATEAVGRPVADLIIPPRLRPAHLAGLERVANDGPSRILGRSVEVAAQRQDGTRFPVQLDVTQTSTDPPRFTGWIRDRSGARVARTEATRRAALLARAEELAQLGSWIWDLGTDVLRWSDNLYRIFGLEPGEVSPTVDFFNTYLHPDDRQKVATVLDAGRREGQMRRVDYRIVRPDGAVRHLRASQAPVDMTSGGQGRLIGTIQDITDERLAEREIGAHFAVSKALAEWEAPQASAERLLAYLAEAMDFDIGLLWLPRGNTLTMRAAWHAPSVNAGPLVVASAELRVRADQDLPGAVWAAQEPLQVAQVPQPGSARAAAIERAGLRSAIAFPAMAGDRVLAVLEFYGRDAAELTPRMLRSLAGIGYELGQFLIRRGGQLEPALLTPREVEILQLAAHGASTRGVAEQLVVSPATIKTHFEHIYRKLGVSDRAEAVARGLRQGIIE